MQELNFAASSGAWKRVSELQHYVLLNVLYYSPSTRKLTGLCMYEY